MASHRRIRILHVITRLVLGGAQENTLRTVAHLDRRRFDITLASGPTQGPEGSVEDLIAADITFVRVPDLIREVNPRRDLRALWTLYRLMRAGRFDIVHTHTTKAGILGRIAGRLARVPILLHTPHGHAFHDYLSPAASRLLIVVERVLATWTDRIICLTAAERADYLQYGIGRPGRFVVIHSGVPVEQFSRPAMDPRDYRKGLGLPAAALVVGCVARLVPVKGVRHLIQAFQIARCAVADARLVIVGDGPQRSELEAMARELELDGSITFTGVRHDISELMHVFDVVAVPSLNEGMGKVAVEAMAASRPVIASDVAGLREVIQNGAGLLVRPADSHSLGMALAWMLRDPDLRACMGEAGRARATAYSLSSMLGALTELYCNLTACPKET